MSSKTSTADQKEIPEVIKDESRQPGKKYERGRFLGKVRFSFNFKHSNQENFNIKEKMS